MSDILKGINNEQLKVVTSNDNVYIIRGGKHMKNSLDKLRIELYGMGEFQGYLKSVSTANQKVYSTNNKYEAKTYAKRETAEKDADRVRRITCGGLDTRIV